MKKFISCCLWHPNPATNWFWLVNTAWFVQISLLIQTRQLCFSLAKAILWTEDSYFSNGLKLKHLNNGLVFIFLQACSFCLLQMLTDGLEWCGLLWCFYQTLILTAPIHCRASIGSHSDGTHSLQSIHWLSFWRHPFTAEHPLALILTAPIHCRASIVEQVMLRFSKSET